jgi:predicted Ser/Thr protein kinase
MVETLNVVGEIEHFKLLKKLGEGQFGTGYMGFDGNKFICVKVFKNDDKQANMSFKVELKQGSLQMNHPNVLKLFGAGRETFTLNN